MGGVLLERVYSLGIVAFILLFPAALAHAAGNSTVEEQGNTCIMCEHHEEISAATDSNEHVPMEGAFAGCGMWSMMGYGFGGLGFAGMLLWWLIWVIAIAAVVYIVMKLLKGSTEAVSDSPVNILKKRFARGDITKQQFEEMKKELEK
jgi:putative membrane protein